MYCAAAVAVEGSERGGGCEEVVDSGAGGAGGGVGVGGGGGGVGVCWWDVLAEWFEDWGGWKGMDCW